MRKLFTMFLLLFCGFPAFLSATVVVSNSNSNGSYATLGAAFTAINGASQTGKNITIVISGTNTETTAVTATGALGVWTSMTITPSGAAVVTGNLGGVLFTLSAVSSVTIDGLNSGGNSLTFENSNAGATSSVIYLTNGANKIRILNCILKGSNTNAAAATSGALYVLGGSTATLGNNNNSLINCELTASGSNFPYVGVFSAGSTSKLNTNDSIIGCSFHDIFNTTGSLMSGIYALQNTSNMFIYGNAFYQTAARSTSSSGATRVINWQVANGNNVIIRKNRIGGAVANGQGLTDITATAAAQWIGISISTITTGGNIIDSNIISNVRFATPAGTSGASAGSGTLIGITTGTAPVQTVSYNTIRNVICTGSNTTATGTVKGIDVAPATGVTMNVEYNTIDSLFALGTGASVAHNCRGIMTVGAGTVNVRYNKIGTQFSNSIRAGAVGHGTNTQEAEGIYLAGTNAIVCQYNEVANVLNTASTSGPQNIVRGIEVLSSTSGAAIDVSFNRVHDIVTACSNTSTTVHNCVGIGIPVNSGPTITLSYDTIYNIKSAISGTKYICGVYCRNSTAGTQNIKNCLIYGLRDTVSGGVICGIASSGASTLNIFNNMIILGVGLSSGTYNGFYIYGGNPSFVHNSIYIGGSGGTSSCISMPFLNSFPATFTVKNNILMNVRKTGTHIAIGTTSFSNFVCDYNDVITAATPICKGGSLLTTNYNTMTDWQTAGQDAHGVNKYVQFVDSSRDLHLNTALNCFLNGNAQYLAAFATDIDGQARPNAAPPSGPDIGADEFVYVKPTISLAFASNPACVSSSETVTITTSAYQPTYSYTTPSLFNPGNVAAYTFNGVAFSDSGHYVITATDPTGCSVSADSILKVQTCTSTWTGTSSANWNTAANWSPAFVPNNCGSNVTIPSGTPFAPTISASDVSVGDISVAAGAGITLNGKNLSVCGNWNGGSGSAANTVGSGRVILQGTGSTVSGETEFQYLQINSSSSVTINSGATVVMDSLLELKSGTLANNGTLRFVSTAIDNCAMVDNFSSGFNGTLTGNVEAQRYVGGGGNWQHYFSSPINSVSVSQFGASGTAGYLIPTANCDETQAQSGSPYGTFFRFHEDVAATCALKGWEAITSGNTDNGRGYSAYQTGSSVLSLTGALNQSASYTVSGISNTNWASHTTLQGRTFTSGWNLVGNPYLASLQLQSALHSADFNTADVAVWNASGPYAGTFSHYKMQGSGGANPVAVLAPFQGFMINRTTVGSGTFTFAKSELVTTGSQFAKTNDAVLELEVSGNGFRDITRVAFSADATNDFDKNTDAHKFHSQLGHPTLFTLIGNEHISGNVLKELAAGESIDVPLQLEPGADGSFVIDAKGLTDLDLDVTLEDVLTRSLQDLNLAPRYEFSSRATDNWNRFVIHFHKRETAVTGITSGQMNVVNAYMKGSELMVDTRNWTGKSEVRIFNVLGQPVVTQTLTSGLQNIAVENQPAGYLLVQLRNENGAVFTRKVVKR
ncbi:MAG: T9SS type A sorting domain-containing protein [Chitinophagales bacterium]